MRHLKVLFSVATALLLVLGTGCDSGSKKDDKSGDKAKKEKSAGSDKGEKSSKSSGGDLPYEATGPVAEIDGTKIKADEYNEIVQKRHGNARRQLPKAMAERMKMETLNALIDKHLIEREIDKADIEVTDKEAKEEFEKFKSRFPNDKALESFLKFRKISKDKIKEQIKKDLALRKILREKEGIAVSDQEAQKYYDDNPKEFEVSEQVKARHILIKTPKGGDKEAEKKAKEKAEKIAEEVKKSDANFAEIAKNKSEGPSAKKGGDLGFFTKDRMVPEFAEAAFSMKDGEISDPVKTDFGYHIIKREKHKEAKKKTFDEVKEEIVSKLERKRFRNALDGYLADLKEGAEVKKMPDNIKVNASAKQGGPGKGLKGLGNLGGKGKLKLKMNQLKGIEKSAEDGKKSKGSDKAAGDKKK